MTTHSQLAHSLGQELQTRQWKLATAESCTGGWVSQVITEIAGSSTWFDRGFVTYSNQAKQEMLNVSEITLQQHGAVSEATVLAMANGAIQNSQAQASIAISGIAGPSGGTPDKPVGTVWIAWAVKDKVQAQCFHFQGNRQQVRHHAVTAALQNLTQFIIHNS
ncbi:CinA family protein [Candidatus Albibeggiatoa sp. nov. NOAA]|uniref:CinA family protein n=1 Tax=Candidatus Albibeggiatoa sp. nov. NOAA TaxID=3162724 RepID=UPI00330058E9|nr:CinA family protein [Thiotrichaceae bacterium]